MRRDENGKILLDAGELIVGASVLFTTVAVGVVGGLLLSNLKVQQAYENGVKDTLSSFVLNKGKTENI